MARTSGAPDNILPDRIFALVTGDVGLLDMRCRIGQTVTVAQIDEPRRPEPPLDGGETETLLGFLNYQRATLEWKCSGVDAAGMTATVGVSTMTLGGLLKHLAYVEDDWSSRWLQGRDRPDPWNRIDWAATPNWEWETACHETPLELVAFWKRSVERSKKLIGDALADGDLSQPAARTWPDGRARVCVGSSCT